MENFFTRYRNVTVLLFLLMAQVIILATQVRRPETATGESMSLVRIWIVQIFVPGEKAISSFGSGVGSLWRNYIDLRGVREQNEELQAQVDRLRLEQVSLAEDAGQARRLQALLGFKTKFISQTVAAQVIGTSGTDRSRVLYIDKGSDDGVNVDMAVITPKGIVGKVTRVSGHSAQVLQINDATAGAGVMLERSRLRGVMRGTSSGLPEIMHVMADEKIEPGEPVVSSGGDQIYPRGLPIGTVFSTSPDPDGGPFLVVKVKPSANLDRVEEVLVITKVIDKGLPQQQAVPALRAADILAQRLPTITPKPPDKTGAEPPPTSVLYAKKPPSANAEVPAANGAIRKKPAETNPDSQSAPSATDNPVAQAGDVPSEAKQGTSSAAGGTNATPSEPKKPKPPSSTEPAQPQENPR